MRDNKKDQEMAARMKALGIERRSGRCPACHTLIPNGGHANNVAACIRASFSKPRKGDRARNKEGRRLVPRRERRRVA